jgi:DNA polymerase-4
VFVRPNMARYSAWSRRVWVLVGARVPLAQQVGIDEGYLDLTGAVSTAGEAERFLRDLQELIRTETGLDASFGCATSKVVAKIASDHRKPRGVTVVPAGREAAFLAPPAAARPARHRPEVGRAAAGSAGARSATSRR